VRLSKRDKDSTASSTSNGATDTVDAADADEAAAAAAAEGVGAGKGRPTPKRRDSQGQRGPMTAPKTRKEAYARQKQITREQKSTRAAAAPTTKPRTVAEQRAALKRGDPSALPRRDQGTTRKLARDYVDSSRMLSNYLLLLFPLMIVSAIVPGVGAYLEIVVFVAFVGFIVEWYIVGRRIRNMALERFGEAQGGNLTIGFYAGSRAYLPRKWRMPGPQVRRGESF
jgi:hypothetical protein